VEDGGWRTWGEGGGGGPSLARALRRRRPRAPSRVSSETVSGGRRTRRRRRSGCACARGRSRARRCWGGGGMRVVEKALKLLFVCPRARAPLLLLPWRGGHSLAGTCSPCAYSHAPRARVAQLRGELVFHHPAPLVLFRSTFPRRLSTPSFPPPPRAAPSGRRTMRRCCTCTRASPSCCVPHRRWRRTCSSSTVRVIHNRSFCRHLSSPHQRPPSRATFPRRLRTLREGVARGPGRGGHREEGEQRGAPNIV
jgi:hypothetical protein